ISSPPATSSLTSPPPQPAGQSYRPTGPNYYTSVQSTINNPPATATSGMFPSQASLRTPTPSHTPSSAATLGKPTSKPVTSTGSDAFGSLWSSASASAGMQSKTTTSNKGPDLASMAKAKTEAGIWGPSAASRAGAFVAPTASTATGQ